LHLNYTCLEFTALYDTDYVLLATELTLNILKYNMWCIADLVDWYWHG